jgi:tetratricopeptide (TPR) repeat protein
MMPATSVPMWGRQSCLQPAFRPAGPAGKRVRRLKACPTILFFLAASLFAAGSLTEQGISAFAQGRYADAARLLQTAVTQDPSDEHAREFLALAKAASGRCQDVIGELTTRFQKSTDPELNRLAGLALVQCLATGGSTEKALAVATQLEAKYPNDADVLYQAARLHMKAFNDVTRHMFEKTPASYRVNQLSAEIFETQNGYAEAAAEYRKAIAKSPQTVNLHFRLGRAILLESHDPQALTEARKEFEAELALNPSDAAAEFQIGQILNVTGKPAEARPHFQKALDLSPDFAEPALALAKMHIQAKEYPQAIPLLEHVVATQPANEGAHYNLMLAYRNSGHPDKAKEQQQILEKLQRPPEGEFTDFLNKLGEKPVK